MPGRAETDVLDPLAPDWSDVGLVSAYLMLSWRSWLVHRVEALSFQDDLVLRHRISIDFAVPSWLTATVGEDLVYLPIARAPKRSLTSFEIADEHGTRLPVLTPRQSSEASARALLAVGEIVAGPRLSDVAGITEAIRGLVDPSEPTWKLGRARLLDDDVDDADVRKALRDDPIFAGLAEVLAAHSVIYVPLQLTPPRRRVLTFSYDERMTEPSIERRLRWSRLVGWHGKDVLIQLPEFADAPSFHVELEAPPGLQIRRRSLIVLADDTAHLVKDHHRGRYSRARLRHDTNAGEVALGWMVLRPRAATIVRSELGTAIVASVLLGAMVAGMFTGALTKDTRSAAALLLFVPGLLSFFINRSEEHPLVTELLLGIRVLAWAPGLCAFVGATLVAVGNPERCGVRVAGIVVLVLSLLVLRTVLRTWLAVRRSNRLWPEATRSGRTRLRRLRRLARTATAPLRAALRRTGRRRARPDDAAAEAALEGAGVLKSTTSAADRALMIYAWQEGARPSRLIGSSELTAMPDLASAAAGPVISALEHALDERALRRVGASGCEGDESADAAGDSGGV